MVQLETLAQFTGWVKELLARLEVQNRGALPYAKMQYYTGLRATEVLEFDRWQKLGPELLRVQLAKKEETRDFTMRELPAEWLAEYQKRAGLYVYNYGAYINDLKAAGIDFVFNGDKRTTVSHAFRYHKFRELYAITGSVKEVQTIMAHKSAGSTMYYLLDSVSVQDRRAG